jgi:WD40 repeat protein
MRTADGARDTWWPSLFSNLGRPGDWSTAMSMRTPTTRPIVVSGSHDATVRVWDLDAGRSLAEPLAGHGDWVTAVALGEAP